MTTLGDQILDRSLSKVGGKGLFVKELEVALEEGRADLAVHSLKDVPMDLPEGFALACVLEREDPRDAFVSNQLRRRWPSCRRAPWSAPPACAAWCCCKALAARPEDRAPARQPGHAPAQARRRPVRRPSCWPPPGLKRLGLASRIRHTFEPADMLPAAGQGALGIEVRADRADLIEALAPLAHQPTWLAVTAERAVSRAMGGSCSMPLAAFVTAGERRRLAARRRLGRPGHGRALRVAAACPRRWCRCSKPPWCAALTQAEALGEAVAAQLRAGGAVWAGNAPAA